MIIGKIIGNVWATRKNESLNGHKLMIVEAYQYGGGYSRQYPFVAVDTIGAGIGEMVLVVTGSSARVVLGQNNIPVDNTIVGIIDQIDIPPEHKD
ncbi:MAG: EutN/CcmL family microcompartment protein [Clostridiales bacterium]|jgi:ethanolamine utilization protein EutN|nr:EutN/CcmL family microcompartment protein [Clostridiales bacterium]